MSGFLAAKLLMCVDVLKEEVASSHYASAQANWKRLGAGWGNGDRETSNRGNLNRVLSPEPENLGLRPGGARVSGVGNTARPGSSPSNFYSTSKAFSCKEPKARSTHLPRGHGSREVTG